MSCGLNILLLLWVPLNLKLLLIIIRQTTWLHRRCLLLLFFRGIQISRVAWHLCASRCL